MNRRYPDRPVVGVGVVVIRDGAVLLVRRGKAPYRNRWSLPGGAQELDETVIDAARREVREETGLEVDILALLDVVDLIDRDHGDAVRHHYTLVDFLARANKGDARPMDDIDELAWFERSELPGLEMWSETARILDKAYDFLGDGK